MPVEYSVIIVTFNSSGWIRQCLTSIISQQGECDRLEVIVVDNASMDESVAIVRTEFPGVVLEINRRNIGFAAAVNQGAALAHCGQLLFLNPDTSLRPGFFARLNRFFASHPRAGIAGCALFGSDGRRQPSCWKTPGLWTTLLEAALPYGLSLPLVTDVPADSRQVETVSGACMLIGRDDFLKLGCFDTRFFMYYEDFDLCMRARAQGMEVHFIADAAAVHHVRKSTDAAGEMFFLYVFESKLKILQKHESGAGYLLAYLLILAGIAVRIPVYAIVGTLTSRKELLQLSKYHTFVLKKITARPLS